jgi:hypothetical protein
MSSSVVQQKTEDEFEELSIRETFVKRREARVDNGSQARPYSYLQESLIPAIASSRISMACQMCDAGWRISGEHARSGT